MSGRPDLRDVFETVREYFDAIYPGNLGIAITVQLPGSAPATLPVPACMKPAQFSGSANVPNRRPIENHRSALESAILQVFEELPDGETLTGEETAERAGYPYSSRIRETLARFVREGTIANHHPGYCRPEKRS